MSSSKRNPEGVVLATAVPHPEGSNAARGEQVTVYWQGPDTPQMWSPDQRDAARFADEALALHTLRAAGIPLAEGSVSIDRGDGHHRGRMWSEPALHARNCGPTTPVITTAPDGTVAAERDDPQTVQGDLFGGAV